MRKFYRISVPLLLLFLTVIFQGRVMAQAVTVKGKVTDQNDKSTLTGVTVTVKGTSTRTSTDASGNYQLANASPADVLVFTYVGFTTKEIGISTAKNGTLNVTLSGAVNSLNEVVVVGYGTQKKSDVTGAVATVSKERLNDLPNTNFAQALQGSVPGVSINQSSGGAEGQSQSIQIRGRSSITASTAPLIILDGVPYEGSISDINPTDIESINVLKDASSAAIYGSRGSNGVILVTTKKGSRGKPVITYDGFYGIQNITNLPDVLSPDEFYAYKQQREPNSITTTEQAVYDSKNFPNWIDLATRQGMKMQHTLGVNGGGENSRYYVSATYLDTKGVAVNDNFKRASTRINIESTIRPWLTFGSNSQLSYNDRGGLPAIFGDYTGAYRFNPLTTAYNADGSLSIYPWPQDTFFGNPLAPTLASSADETYKVITNNFLNVSLPFVKGLSYRLNTGVEFTDRSVDSYYGVDTRTGLQTKGSLSQQKTNNKNILVENIVNYNRTFGKHSIAFTGLYSFQNQIGRADNLDATGFPNDVLTYYQANVANSIRPSSTYAKQTLLSQMGRLNYAYNSKYLLTLTARRDGFSGFGANNKYAFFPSIAVGWNMSEEPFLKDNKVISNLKVRASYGNNGNQAITPYNTLAQLATRSYIDGSTTLPGYIPNTLATPDLRWETTTAGNLGVDFALFKGRLSGSVDAYVKNTKDLLLNRSISTVHGINSVIQNIGKTANKGLDIGLNSVNFQEKDFSWSTNLNVSINRNKIKDLYGDGKNDTLNTWFIGQPIDVNFEYKYGGVWQTNDNLVSAPQPNVKPGYAKVVDANGDGRITPQGDRLILGSRQPAFIWGLGNTFKYKNFSLYVFMQGVQGISRRNVLLSDNVQNGVRNNTFVKNYWTPTNPTNDYYVNALNANIYNVGIFQSDSYARLKDASFAYDFSPKILKQLGLSRLKVYVNARNLFTITKWTGLDPELSSQEGIPLQKEFILGLNVSL